MITRKRIENQIENLTTLHSMVVAYEEIAATRMRRIKTSVLNNRGFLGGLTDVYGRVKVSYKDEIEKLKKKGERAAGVIKKKPVVAVFLSANTGLYGEIIRKTFSEYMNYIKTGDVDAVVIGRLGKIMVDDSEYDKGYKYFYVSDGTPDPDDVARVIDYVSEYETIVVFHGKFKDILNQIPSKTYVTGREYDERITSTEKINCIFEPALDEVVNFFETQILSALFEQSVYESSLSKYTSRMMSLDTASININNRLKAAEVKKRAIEHNEMNKKQLGILASMQLWS